MRLELKIPPPVVAFFCVAAMWGLTKLSSEFDFDFSYRKSVALVLLIVGLVIDILALTSFKKNQTTINPMQPEQSSILITSGIYKFSRNPMYLGLLLILTACVMFLGSTPFIMLPIFIFYITRFQILPEEIILQKKFPKSYVLYKSRVRRWI